MNTPENNTFVPDLIAMEFVAVKDIYIYLKEYLDYLIDLHKRYVVCFDYKEMANKATLENKIEKLTDRVNKLKSQLDKYSNDTSIDIKEDNSADS